MSRKVRSPTKKKSKQRTRDILKNRSGHGEKGHKGSATSKNLLRGKGTREGTRGDWVSKVVSPQPEIAQVKGNYKKENCSKESERRKGKWTGKG